ncbi:TRAP transporter substrate-binding protein [Cupriavidus pauculus]|uniref:TRAP transporter substrate-binding protein n=1 Tax=Cupriavidus pauculus TaxID=82633 RepID=UPI00208C7A17|nr:DctP family TRAP transporter solute-binding subunit [Cupriavidus pauculus]
MFQKPFARTRLGTLMAALATAVALPVGVHAAEFRSADIHPDDYPTVQAVRYMGDLLKQRSNGKMSVKVFAQGSLGSEKDAIEQTKIGALSMVRVNSAAMNNICEATIVPTMPFLFRSTEHMRHVLDGQVGEDILKSCEKNGFIGLAWYDSGSRSMYTTKRPIKTLADAKGMKIRVQQSDLWVSLLEAMHANATPMPWGEVYTALKTGLVDGAENNWPSYESSRQFEVAKYYSLTEHSMAPEMLMFSKVAWDRLSKEDQAMVRQAAKDSVPYMRKLWDEREQKSRKLVEASGVQIIQVDKTSFQSAMKPVYDRFITSAQMKDLVRRTQETK